jgi:hypothetical protein
MSSLLCATLACDLKVLQFILYVLGTNNYIELFSVFYVIFDFKLICLNIFNHIYIN